MNSEVRKNEFLQQIALIIAGSDDGFLKIKHNMMIGKL